MGAFGPGAEPLPRGLIPVPEAQRTVKVLWPSLNQVMRKFLIARAGTGTDIEAAEIAGTSSSQIAQWKKEVPGFGAAYNVMMTAPVDFAQGYIKGLAPKIVGALEDALEASTYRVAGTDPDGNPKYKKVPSHRERLKAVELGLRANGLLATKVDITERSLRYEEKLVRYRLEKGLDVPDPILRELLGEE